MTIDERIDKLEFVVAGHVQQAEKDYAENRQLWREAQEDDKRMRDGINRLRMETLDLRSNTENYIRRLHEEVATNDRFYKAEQAERDRILDERIEKLVSAMDKFIVKSDEEAARSRDLDERIGNLIVAINQLVQREAE